MAKRGLTGNEKQVMYGLVRHPVLNDRELSELLDVKVSTVTAIRRRLRRAEYFVTRRIPMMNRLGWELLIGGHARIGAAPGLQALPRLRETLRDRFPTLFHVAASSEHMSFLGFAHNYTTARSEVDDLRQGLDRAKLLADGDLDFSAFPLSLSIVPSFFDYSHALALAFDIDDRMAVKPDHAKVGDLELSRKETEVLKGLVRYPELSDKALAGRVRVSRQAVSKMRREFEAEGLLRTARLPNLRLLGFELYVHASAHFTPSSTVRSRLEAFDRLLKTSQTFFLASDDAELIAIGAARTYEQFSTLRSALTKYFDEREHLAGDPEVFVGLTSATEMLRNCEFGPLVQGLTPPEPKPS